MEVKTGSDRADTTDWYVLERRRLKYVTKPTIRDWAYAVRGFDQELDSSPFWRGDLLNLGIKFFGDDAVAQVFEPGSTGLKTWLNNASVCRRVPAPRRRESLSYSHHAEVAYLEEDQQERYLDLAVENGWSVRELREAIREAQKKESPEKAAEKLADRLVRMAERVEEMREEVPVQAARDLLLTAEESLRDAAAVIEGAKTSLKKRAA